MVQEEDAQLLTEPIIQPIKQRSFMVQEKNLPVTRYDKKCVAMTPARRADIS